MKNTYLTAREVDAVKPDPKHRLELPAGVVPSLYLVVQPSGAKSWALRYRYKGRPRKLTLGKYPALSLADARGEAADSLKTLAKGDDPALAKVKERTPETFADAFDEFLGRHLKPNTRSWREVERIFRKECLPRFGRVPIEDVTPADVLRMLDAIRDRGASVTANRALSAVKRMYGWRRKSRKIAEPNPVADMDPPTTENGRDRVLTMGELSEIWRALPALGYPLTPFYQLLVLTAQRRNEIATMRWTDLDLEAGLWTLPSEFNKAGRIHDVALSEAALEVLAGLPRFGGPYVLSTTGGQRPISGFSKAKARLDGLVLGRRREDDPEAEPMARWTIHDIRRTVSTELARAGVPPQVLAAILNHSPGRLLGITAVYNRHKYSAERRQALEAWARRVTAMAEPDRQREAV